MRSGGLKEVVREKHREGARPLLGRFGKGPNR